METHGFTLVDWGRGSDLGKNRGHQAVREGTGASPKERPGAPREELGKEGRGRGNQTLLQTPLPTRKCLSTTPDPTGAPLPGPGGRAFQSKGCCGGMGRKPLRIVGT